MTELNTEALAAAVSGEVLRPGDADYDEARRVWNVRFDGRPAAVVRCADAEDVRSAVRFAHRGGLQLSVKGGGHAYAANTVGDDGLLVDLSRMKGLTVDPEAKTARVEPGVTWGEFDQAAQQHALATPGGTVSTVGVAGLALGGGAGYLSRKHGMTIDNLLSADVVIADGGLIRASLEENADLFWALRGGGGNFGVVTSFEFKLHELGPEVLAGQIVHRFDDARDVLRLYRDFMDEAPDEIQCYAFVLRVPPIDVFPKEFHGELAIDLVVFHTDVGGEESLRPLLDFGDPILAFVARQAYTEVQQAFDASLPAGHRYESRAHYFTALSDEALEAFTANVNELPGPFTVAYFGAEGGAIGHVSGSATAFPHRDAAYSLHVLAGWTDPDRDTQVTAWARQLHEAMSPYATGGVYVNLLGTGEQERVEAAYGANHHRLRELKRQWDPANLFRMNHNIKPMV